MGTHTRDLPKWIRSRPALKYRKLRRMVGKRHFPKLACLGSVAKQGRANKNRSMRRLRHQHTRKACESLCLPSTPLAQILGLFENKLTIDAGCRTLSLCYSTCRSTTRLQVGLSFDVCTAEIEIFYQGCLLCEMRVALEYPQAWHIDEFHWD